VTHGHDAGDFVVKNRWGQARREVFVLRDLILRRIASGETVRQIWEDLTNSGQLSIVLSKFYAHVRTLQKEAASARASSASRPSRIAPSPQTAPNTASVPAVSPAQEDDVLTLLGQSTFKVNPHPAPLLLKRAEDGPEAHDRSKEPSFDAD